MGYTLWLFIYYFWLCDQFPLINFFFVFDYHVPQHSTVVKLSTQLSPGGRKWSVLLLSDEPRRRQERHKKRRRSLARLRDAGKMESWKRKRMLRQSWSLLQSFLGRGSARSSSKRRAPKWADRSKKKGLMYSCIRLLVDGNKNNFSV